MLTYPIDIAGLQRELPICPLNENLSIGAFVIFGDVEMTVHAAAKLLEKLPEVDCFLAPEAKTIPLVYEMSRQSGIPYFIARKKAKAYMTGVLKVEVQSITTEGSQTLILDTAEAAAMRGKRIAIVDDVISTGETLRGVEELVKEIGGTVAARAAVLAEGDAYYRDDIIVLAQLPLFNPDGTVKK